jgi:hypothetical protein
MLCDGNAKLRAIVAEISNHLIFGNDCRKLGGVVKEGQGIELKITGTLRSSGSLKLNSTRSYTGFKRLVLK